MLDLVLGSPTKLLTMILESPLTAGPLGTAALAPPLVVFEVFLIPPTGTATVAPLVLAGLGARRPRPRPRAD